MAWRRRTGNKSLPEPKATHLTDAYMRHLGRWVKVHVDVMYIDYVPSIQMNG